MSRLTLPLMFRPTDLVLAILVALATCSALPAAAECLDCDAIYATGCDFELWQIDPVSLVAVEIGTTPEFMVDIAATPDGRLFMLGISGGLWEFDACTGETLPAPGGPGGNGLGSDLATALLYGQGPPLTATDPATGVTTVIGGMIGTGPPDWCGLSSGDLAFQPGTGTLFSTLFCFGGLCTSGDTLVHIDPATGNVITEVGCAGSAAGVGFPDVHGLAFDSEGTLWGSLGAVVVPEILNIDPADGTVTTLDVTGGYVCGTGLAIMPCAGSGPDVDPSDAILECLWPPNHWYVCFGPEDFDFEVATSPSCGEPSWRFAGCASDQPDDAPEGGSRDWKGDGSTRDDCVVLEDGQGICVRAERAGAGPTAEDGRHYSVSIVAEDECGGESAETVVGTIDVPHDSRAGGTKDCLDTTKVGCRPNQPIPCPK